MFGKKYQNLSVGFLGEWHPATILATRYDRQADVAVLAVEGNYKIPAYPLYESELGEGDYVSFYGFRGDTYSKYDGRVTDTSRGINSYRGMVYEGMSGGAVVVGEEGTIRTVGVIGGYDRYNRRSAAGTGLLQIRRMLGGMRLSNPHCSKPRRKKPRPEVTPRPPDINVEIDYKKLTDLVIARIKAEGLIQNIKGDQGDKGDKGDQGPKGDSGLVTLIIKQNGKELYRLPNVVIDSFVEVPVETYVKPKKKKVKNE